MKKKVLVCPLNWGLGHATRCVPIIREQLAAGKYVVTWAFNFTPNVDTWRAGVVAALTQYSAGGGWDDVVTAFV